MAFLQCLLIRRNERSVPRYEDVRRSVRAAPRTLHLGCQGKRPSSPPLLYPGALVGATAGQEIAPKRKASDTVGIRTPVVQPVS